MGFQWTRCVWDNCPVFVVDPTEEGDIFFVIHTQNNEGYGKVYQDSQKEREAYCYAPPLCYSIFFLRLALIQSNICREQVTMVAIAATVEMKISIFPFLRYLG
jgi:hypothetical protein